MYKSILHFTTGRTGRVWGVVGMDWTGLDGMGLTALGCVDSWTDGWGSSFCVRL